MAFVDLTKAFDLVYRRALFLFSEKAACPANSAISHQIILRWREGTKSSLIGMYEKASHL